MAENQEVIFRVGVNVDDAVKQVGALSAGIKVLNEEEKKLTASVKSGEIGMDAYAEELGKVKVQRNFMQASLKEVTKAIKDEQIAQKSQEGSLVQLRKELTQATTAYDSMSRAERESAKGQDLKNHIKELNAELKPAEEATERFTRNVGNYQSAVDGLTKTGNPVADNMIAIVKNGGSAKDALKATGAQVKTFGVQLRALATNPIILIIGAIVAVFMTLKKGIESSEESMNRWSVLMAPVGRALDFFLNIVQKGASLLLDFIEANVQMVEVLMQMAEVLPFVGDKIKAVNEANREAVALERERQAVVAETREQNVLTAQNEYEIAELRIKANDRVKYSLQERAEFAEKAIRLEEENLRKENDLNARREQIAIEEASRNENDAKTNEELNRLRVEQIKRETEFLTNTRRLQTQRVALEVQIQKEQQDALNETIKANEELIKVADERAKKEDALRIQSETKALELMRDGNAKRIIEVNRSADAEILALENRLKTEENLTVKSRQYISDTIESIEELRIRQLRDLQLDETAQRITDTQTRITEELSLVQKGTEEELKLQLGLSKAREDLDVINATRELETEEEKEEAKARINKKYLAERGDLEAQFQKELLNKQKAYLMQEYELQLARAYGNAQELTRIKLEYKKKELEELREADFENNTAYLLAQQNLNNELIALQRSTADAEIAIQQEKANAITGVFNSLSNLFAEFGEENEKLAKASQVIALAEVAINSGLAIAQMWTAESVKGVLGIPLAIAGTASIVASMATAVANIKSAKFAEGGLVTGAGTTTSDSIPAMLSNQESVINARSTAMFMPELSAINQAGGGVPIGTGKINTDILSRGASADDIATALKATNIEVSVVEIAKVSNKVKVSENLSNA